MCCGDCDAAKAGSGDEGLGLLCFDLSSEETDFWWLEDEH